MPKQSDEKDDDAFFEDQIENLPDEDEDDELTEEEMGKEYED